MEQKVVFGIIGAGMIGDVHIECINRDGRGKVKWICTRTEKTLREKKEKWGISHMTTEYRDILNDTDVNAVIICTPPDTHAQILIDACKSGKHVLVEKPLCIRREDVERILDTVHQYPELVIMECCARYTTLNPKGIFLKQMIREGKLGEIYYIRQCSVVRQSRPGIEYNPGAYWFLDKEQAGGGPVMDFGGYDFAFVFHLFEEQPELKKMICHLQNGLDKVPHGDAPFTVEEHGTIMMEFENGLLYNYERAMNAHNEVPSQLRIYGTKGGVTLSYEPWLSSEIEYYYVDNDGKGKAVKETIAIDCYQEETGDFYLIQHFLDCIIKGSQNTMPLDKVAKKMKILLEIEKQPISSSQ